jgi:hypothetical protein
MAVVDVQALAGDPGGFRTHQETDRPRLINRLAGPMPLLPPAINERCPANRAVLFIGWSSWVLRAATLERSFGMS